MNFVTFLSPNSVEISSFAFSLHSTLQASKNQGKKRKKKAVFFTAPVFPFLIKRLATKRFFCYTKKQKSALARFFDDRNFYRGDIFENRSFAAACLSDARFALLYDRLQQREGYPTGE
ncbi:MAG: hypothetical protein II328_00575 [Clostridia bacterium]|nr:hypothetical protein [Clostridia bacterium]